MASNEDEECWLYGGGEEEGTAEGNDTDPPPITTFTGQIQASQEISQSPPPLETETPQSNGINQELDTTPVEEESNFDPPTEDDTTTLDNLDASKSGLEDEPIEEGEGAEDDDSEDSEDDDVQVTIGDIKATPYNYGVPPVNLNIKQRPNYVGPAPGAVAALKPKGIDLEAIGAINGVPTYEFNLDTLEDKPWRKPGADITDYFNYGFDEDSWRTYCERQRKIRTEIGGNAITALGGSVNPIIKVVGAGAGIKDIGVSPISAINENSKYNLDTHQFYLGSASRNLAGPPPGRKLGGAIDVIGTLSTVPTRRTDNIENIIQVIGGRRKELDLTQPPPVFPPPVGLPPPSFVPPDMSVPPPGFGGGAIPSAVPPVPTSTQLLIPPPVTSLPPPALPPGTAPPHLFPPPPHLPPPPAAFSAFPPPIPAATVPTTSAITSFYNGSAIPSLANSLYKPKRKGEWDSEKSSEKDWGDYPPGASPPRERSHGRDTERERSHSHRDRGGDEYEYEREKDRDRRHHREREREHRDRERDRSREREHRDRDSDRYYDERRDRERRHRDRDRDRDYERSRDREREYRDREKDREHRSSRRKHRGDSDEDSRYDYHEDSSSSRHKKSKRSRRDRDEDGVSSSMADESPDGGGGSADEKAD